MRFEGMAGIFSFGCPGHMSAMVGQGVFEAWAGFTKERAMRHVLGVLGVLAAGVLLAVSAAMNWRFGLSLGRTELDGQIYGAASAAADCLKALIPFFFFAAVRNRVWSQALASAVLWVVITAYSLTSALGHAALNRFDTTGQRAQTAQVYQDLRADLKRSEEKLGWIPRHRPFDAVQSEIDGMTAERGWRYTKGCQRTDGPRTRAFCQRYHELQAELASASGAKALDAKITGLKAKIAGMDGTPALSEADPQAKVLADLAGAVIPAATVEHVQMAMTVFIALLLEVGSAFGMWVAFSQWRLYERQVVAVPTAKSDPVQENTVAATVAAPALEAPQPVVVQATPPNSGANDNRLPEMPQGTPDVAESTSAVAEAAEAPAEEEQVAEVRPVVEARASAPARHIPPESNTELFYRENIEVRDGSSVTATRLYEDYCSWCKVKDKEPSSISAFSREFAELGIKKEKVRGKRRFNGIALKSDIERRAEATKRLTYQAKAA